jgi:hypothetical protein
VEVGDLDDIAAEVLHGCLIFRRDGIPAEDLESGMTPVGEHGDQVFFYDASSATLNLIGQKVPAGHKQKTRRSGPVAQCLR